MADKEVISGHRLRFSHFVCLFCVFTVADAGHVVRFESPTNSVDDSSIVSHRLAKRRAHSNDSNEKVQFVINEKCRKREYDFPRLNDHLDIDHSYVFQNETKSSIALVWAGENDGVLLLVTSKDDWSRTTTIESTVYRSDDFGVSFDDITKSSAIENVIRRHNGLQRNEHDPGKVYLVSTGTVLYITEDGGRTFSKHNAGFTLQGEFIYHSSPDYSSYLLAISTANELYISFDNGKVWAKILSNVEKVFWGVLEEASKQDAKVVDTDKTVYASVGGQIKMNPVMKHFFGLDSVTTYTLKKSTNGGSTWTTIRENVISFERQGHFLYASVLKDPNEIRGYRLLQISTNGGATWHEAQLPTIEPDRFYSVMDVEDKMIFMHVDNPDDTGHGTLYTSANQGVVYSESLPMHLYPNFGEVHDFYKVKSLRGVYITSQMSLDDSIHSMITYNQGGTWQKIPRPTDGTPCHDETKDCYLQLHGLYSMKAGIQAIPPASEAEALGIIIAHGHVSDSLQKTPPPDVYVSHDGGYSWEQSLKGPHYYSIGDHGGFLAAVPMETYPKILKFSTDEGRCWHEYTFTNKTLTFTGILTEPEGKSSVVMIWGYIQETKKWEVHVIDFKAVIPRKCESDDYEVWMAHSKHRIEEGVDIQGCLLGKRETFERLKTDSWCYNGYNKERKTTKSACKCTREDYECDYGYFRPGGSDVCIKMKEFTGPEVDFCLRGHEEKIVSEGYRKIPSDSCSGGFTPKSKEIDMKKACSETSKDLVEFDETEMPGTPIPMQHQTLTSTLKANQASGLGPMMHSKIWQVNKQLLADHTYLIAIVGTVIGVGLVMSIYFLIRFKKHQVPYRHSEHDDDDHGLHNVLTPTLVFHRDSDNDLITDVQPQSPMQHVQNSQHDDPDDEMLA